MVKRNQARLNSWKTTATKKVKFCKYTYSLYVLLITLWLASSVPHELLHVYQYGEYGIRPNEICFVGFADLNGSLTVTSVLNGKQGWYNPYSENQEDMKYYKKVFDEHLDEFEKKAYQLSTTSVSVVLLIFIGAKLIGYLNKHE